MRLSLKNQWLSLVIMALLALTTSGVIQAAFSRTAHADSFPSDAVWRYADNYVQAWARQIETDGSSGTHWNFVVQTPGGGNLLRDFHLTFEGIVEDASGAQNYIWGVNESVQGFCSQIIESVGPGSEGASMNAVAKLANSLEELSVGLYSAVSSAAYDAGEMLWQLFQGLMELGYSGGCTVATLSQPQDTRVVV